MNNGARLKLKGAPIWLKAFISPMSAVMGASLVLQLLILLVFKVSDVVILKESLDGIWQSLIAPAAFTGLFFLCVYAFPVKERKGIIYIGCMTVISGLFVFDILFYPDSVIAFNVSILSLLALWLGGYVYYIASYSSPVYIRTNLITDLPKDLKVKAYEAIKVYEEVRKALERAPEAYRQETPELVQQVEDLVDKLLTTYPIIASLQGYRSHAAKDAEAKSTDSAFARSSDVLEKLCEKVSRILGLLHEVQGWVLIMLAGSCDFDDPNTSPVEKVKKITQDLALQAAALDEINERLGEK